MIIYLSICIMLSIWVIAITEIAIKARQTFTDSVTGNNSVHVFFFPKAISSITSCQIFVNSIHFGFKQGLSREINEYINFKSVLR